MYMIERGDIVIVDETAGTESMVISVGEYGYTQYVTVVRASNDHASVYSANRLTLI